MFSLIVLIKTANSAPPPMTPESNTAKSTEPTYSQVLT